MHVSQRPCDGVQSAAFATPEPKSQFRGDGPVASPSAAELEKDNPSLRVITDDIAASLDPDIERKRSEAAEAAWGGSAPAAHDASATAAPGGGDADARTAASSTAENGAATVGSVDSGSGSQPAAAAAASSGGSTSTAALTEMTTEELEAELRRRQAARSS